MAPTTKKKPETKTKPYVAAPPPVNRPGRSNRMYYDLFEAVMNEHGPGVPVCVREFEGWDSAYEARALIVTRRRPVPGGPSRWIITARRVPAKDWAKNKGVRSRLYVEWRGARK